MMHKNRNRFIQYMLVSIALLFILRGHAMAQTRIQAGTHDRFVEEISIIYKNADHSTSGQNAGSACPKPKMIINILMVKTKGQTPDCGGFEADTVVQGPDNQYALYFRSQQVMEKVYQILLHDKHIIYVEKDQEMMLSSTGWSWGLKPLGIPQFLNQVKLSAGAISLKVALVDTGVYKSSYFASRVLKGKNLLKNTSDTDDKLGHGTHIAGTIYDVTKGLNVNILPVKIFSDDGRTTSVIMGNGVLYAADHGAKVINISANIINNKHSEYLHNCINYAVKKGVVVVASAGNDYGKVENACPADMKNVIVVGAMTEGKERCIFSNIGSSLDFMAPGVNIKSAKVGGGTICMTGTSMAAPHISGICALLKLLYPSYSPASIENKLKSVCRDMDKAGWDEKTGWGYPDLSKITAQPAASVSLDQTALTMTASEVLRLSGKVLPENTTNPCLQWTSSNPNIVRVFNGTIIAVSKGEAVITVSTANGKKATCRVLVKAAPRLDADQLKLKSYSVSEKKCVIEGSLLDESKASGIQYQLQNEKKKTIAVKTASKSKSVAFQKLKSQKLYIYRARYYYDISGIRVYGSWSKRRTFSTAVVEVKKLKNHSGIEYTIPSVKGVSTFKVEFSLTGKSGSFQKVRTGKQGRTYRLTTYKGKSLKKYCKNHKFYLRLKPKSKFEFAMDSKYVKKKITLK